MPESQTASQPSGLVVGHFHYDTLVNGHIRILPSWLVTSNEEQVASRVAALHGGQPHADNTQQYYVHTHAAVIGVLLDSIRLQMVLRHGSTLRTSCDSRAQRTQRGRLPCQCPGTLKARWEAAKTGRGCEPLVHVTFRLADDPALGRFLFSSASWTFAEQAAEVKAALRGQQRPVRIRLGIDRALHTTASGTTFAYTRPTIQVVCYWSLALTAW